MADNNFIPGLGKSLLSQGASSLLGGTISNFFGSLAQDRATEASKDLMREQYAYQRQNNLDAMTLARQSKEKAGFNVNADGSFTPSVNPPQAGQTAIQPQTLSQIDASQLELNAALEDKYRAEAETIRKTLPFSLENLHSATNLNLSQSLLNDANRLYQQIKTDFLERHEIAEIENLWSDTADKNMRALLGEAGISKIGKEIEHYNALIENISKDTELKGALKVQAFAMAYKARMEAMFTQKQAERYDQIITSELKKNDVWMSLTDEQKAEVKARVLLYGKDLEWYDDKAVADIVNKYADTVLKGAQTVESGTKSMMNVRKTFLGF